MGAVASMPFNNTQSQRDSEKLACVCNHVRPDTGQLFAPENLLSLD